MKIKNDILGYKDLKIIQDTTRFSFTLDSILLARFINFKNNQKTICDLGTNHAIIPLIISKYTKAKIHGVEIQEESCNIALENLKLNNLENQIEIFNQDMKTFIKDKNNFYDVIISNPPYFNLKNHSKLSKKGEAHQISRHELEIDLTSLCRTAAIGCKQGGKFYIIHLSERIDEIMTKLTSTGFAVKKIRFIFSRKGQNSNKVLIESVYKGNKSVEVLEPLIIYEKNNKYTKEVERLFED